MKRTTANAIEKLTNDLNMVACCGKITLVLRPAIHAKEHRPNAFILTRGQRGRHCWIRCLQVPYYFLLGQVVFSNDYVILHDGKYHSVDYRPYTDDEILKLVDDIRSKGVTSNSACCGWYISNV